MGSVDVAAHDGAVTCVNFPLGSFLGPVGAVSLFFEIIFSRGSALNVILVNPTQLSLVTYCRRCLFLEESFQIREHTLLSPVAIWL